MSFGQQKTQHEEFLDKKKEEFLRKKQQISVTASPITVAPVVAGFVNDGSFLARVQAMQKQMSSSGASSSSSKPPSGASSSIEKSSGSSSSLNSLEKLPQKISIKLEEPSNSSMNVLTTVKKPAVFQDDDEVTDANPYEIAKGLAERVACEGLKAEAEARVKFQNDSRYRFLFESGSPIAAFYKSCIQQMKSGNVGPDAGEKPRKRRWDSDGEQSQSSTTSSSLESAAPGPEGDAVLDFEKTMALVRAKAEAAKSGVPIVAGPTQEDIERQKAIEEQRMMQEIYRKVVEQQAKKAKESGKRRKGDKPNYGYDSDEDTEGGTWEHKKRIEEMEKTKEWAMRLTSDGRGKHHIADFLPADELEKFMEKVKAVREGRDADFSDYSKYRIQSDNLGYQLLQKAGWSEGKGLGAKEEGILQPINKGKATFDQSGVGAEKPAEVKKEDDDFDLYRKRMMLAYKFRPNPLNNPRRPYY